MVYQTNKLRHKYLKNENIEVLDHLLQKNMLSVEEHEAGIKLRLIRNQRFGKPFAKSRDISIPSQGYIEREETAEDERNQLAYRAAINMLSNIGAREVVLNVCVFDVMPSSIEEFRKLREGFAVLSATFKEYLSVKGNFNG